MAYGVLISFSLCLILSTVDLTHQTKSTSAMLTSLKNMDFDNSHTTVTLNPTVLWTLLAMCGAAQRNVALQKRTNGVSFSVNVKAKPLRLGGGQTIIYDEILTNDGNGYDDRTGVFTCPVAGTYMFVVDSLSSKPAWLHIYLNKTKVASLHVNVNHNANSYVQMSRTVILKLKKGDHVKIVNRAAVSTSVAHQGYSGFSGTKLY